MRNNSYSFDLYFRRHAYKLSQLAKVYRGGAVKFATSTIWGDVRDAPTVNIDLISASDKDLTSTISHCYSLRQKVPYTHFGSLGRLSYKSADGSKIALSHMEPDMDNYLWDQHKVE
ncbi:hypothetical protein CEK25_002416 [Fusarium fujikuroi]|nr:hypothetical protein CEK25_002416 [Fusarium fujikuroi]